MEIIYKDKIEYQENGLLHSHREDGPAVIHSNGIKEWYLNGKQHREDGPALEYPDGTVSKISQESQKR